MLKQLSGILLAGGKSSRMGTEKGLMMFRGRPLSSYALELLTHYCDEVLISSSHPGYSMFGLPMVADEYPDLGPMGGIYSALKQCSNEWCLALACDIPFVNRELIEALKGEASVNCGCVIPVHHGFLEPLAALYHRRIIPEMELALKENRPSLYRLIHSSGPCLLNVDHLLTDNPLLFTNLNDREDLETLSTG